MLAHLKSVLRRPLNIILLLLLVGAVTFGFTARTAEYLTVTQAVEELSGYYRAIGTLSAPDGDVAQGAKLLANSDLVTVSDVQRSCSGTLQGMYNTDLDGQTSTKGYNVAQVLLWGELTDKRHFVSETASRHSREYYQLQFRVVQRLSGYPDYAPEGSTITVTYLPQEEDTGWAAAFEALSAGSIYGVKACYSSDSSLGSGLFLRQALPGEEWLLPLDDPRMDALVQADAVQEINRHRVVLNSTKDMSALPFAQEANRDGYLVEGRWLNAADNAAGNPVCVVLQDFAQARDLQVGDTLTITLQDEQLSYGYYSADTLLEDARPSGVTTTFTIVGIFNRTIFSEGYASASYRSLNLYIPDSCMPASYDQAVASLQDGWVSESRYSFVLKDPDVAGEFLQRYQKKLESMGYTVTLLENGWTEFSASARPICQSTGYSAALFALLQCMVLALAAFLYCRQHRREFAIAQALGIPAARVIRWHLLPVLLGGAASIGTAGLLAWQFAGKQAQASLAALARQGQTLQTELPVWVLGALLALSLGLLAGLTLAGYLLLSRRPVLDMLRDPPKIRQAHKEPVSPSPAAKAPAPLSPCPDRAAPAAVYPAGHTAGSRIPGLMRFIGRQIRRSKGTTALLLAVSMVFMLALGYMQAAILQTSQKLEEMYQGIQVEAELLPSVSGSYAGEPGYIAGSTVDALTATGFVQNSRLVAASTDVGLSPISGQGGVFSGLILCGITSTDLLNQDTGAGMMVTGGDGVITYESGWDESLFSKDYGDTQWYPIVVSENMLKTLHADLNDQVVLSAGSRGVTAMILGSYTGQFNGLGTLTGEAVLMPLALMQQLYSDDLYYSIAEFSLDPACNRNLDSFRAAGNQIVAGDTQSLLSLNLVIWDEELRMVVQPLEKSLTLLQVLYPIAQGVVFLAAGAVALLLLLQETRTAAILRVLGIPRRTVQGMLAGKLLVLGLAGAWAGILAAAAWGKWTPQLALCAAVYLAGLVLGAILGCSRIVQKKPLEFLQVKE